MNLLQMGLSGGIFILAVALIRALTINKLPKMLFLVLWYIAFARLLLPVTVPVAFHGDLMAGRGLFLLDTLGHRITDFTAEFLPNQPGSIGDKATPMVQDNGSSVSVLRIIWAVGAVSMAGFFVVSYFRCRREFQTALPVPNDAAPQWLLEHPLWRAVEIRQLTGLATPLTYGVLHPVILLPKDTDWESGQMKYILYHEYVHIRRFDAVGKWIASAALCIHWFHPLVWVLYVLFNRDVELSCDECVIRHFGERSRKEYAVALLRMEEHRNALEPFGNYFSKNATEERIKAIMKFKKKTMFTLAFAAILAVAGTIAVFAMPPKTGNTDNADIGDVLRGEASFFYVSDGMVEAKNISDVPALFAPDDAYIKIWAFAVVDLDGDGNEEVVLSVMGAAGDAGGSLILYPMDGKVYGYTANYRSLVDLKADGTYSYSDPTGMVEAGICSVAEFTQTGYTVDKITYGRGTYAGWDTFVVNHQSATEEAFWIAENEQAQKPDAAWYDFSSENIRERFGE